MSPSTAVGSSALLKVNGIECWITFPDRSVVREFSGESAIVGETNPGKAIVNVKLALSYDRTRVFAVYWIAKKPISAMCRVLVTSAWNNFFLTSDTSVECLMRADDPRTQHQCTSRHPSSTGKSLSTGKGLSPRHCTGNSKGRVTLEIRRTSAFDDLSIEPPAFETVWSADAKQREPYATFVFLFERVEPPSELRDRASILSGPRMNSTGCTIDIKKRRNLAVDDQPSERSHPEKRQRLASLSPVISASGQDIEPGSDKTRVESDNLTSDQALDQLDSESGRMTDERTQKDVNVQRESGGECGGGRASEKACVSQGTSDLHGSRENQLSDNDEDKSDHNLDDSDLLARLDAELEGEIRALMKKCILLCRTGQYLSTKLVHLKLKAEIREAKRRYATLTASSGAEESPAASESDISDGESVESSSLSSKVVDLETKIAAEKDTLLTLRKNIYKKNKTRRREYKSLVQEKELECDQLRSQIAAAISSLGNVNQPVV